MPRRRTQEIPDHPLIHKRRHKFPYPADAEQRDYCDETPWLAIPNWHKEWGPWGVQQYPGKAPLWLAICTDLWDKPAYKGATSEQRDFLFSLWRHVADESNEGVVWGEPAKMRRRMNISEVHVFAELMAYWVKAGFAVYLSDAEYEQFRTLASQMKGGKSAKDTTLHYTTEQKTTGHAPAKSKSQRASSSERENEDDTTPQHSTEPQTTPPPPSVLSVGSPLLSPFSTAFDRQLTLLGQAIPGCLRPSGPLDLSDTVGLLAIVRSQPQAWDWVQAIYTGLNLPYRRDSRRWRENCGSFGSAYLSTIGSGLPEPLLREILAHDVREAVRIGRKSGRLNKPKVWWHVHKERLRAARDRCRSP